MFFCVVAMGVPGMPLSVGRRNKNKKGAGRKFSGEQGEKKKLREPEKK